MNGAKDSEASAAVTPLKTNGAAQASAGDGILLLESHYADDETDEYWSRPPTGRKVRFLDEFRAKREDAASQRARSPGRSKRPNERLVTREVMVEQVYYSRFNVELSMNEASCCSVS